VWEVIGPENPSRLFCSFNRADVEARRSASFSNCCCRSARAPALPVTRIVSEQEDDRKHRLAARSSTHFTFPAGKDADAPVTKSVTVGSRQILVKGAKEWAVLF
jgi:hypothetical protein